MLSTRSIYMRQGRTIHINQKTYLNFTGTSYLGIIQNEEFITLVKRGLDRYGVFNGASRLAMYQERSLFEEAENFLCRWTGGESCLTFSSGTLAGTLIVQMLETEANALISENAHPAIRPVMGRTFGSLTELEEVLQGQPSNTFAIYLNSVDPIQCEIVDIERLRKLDRPNLTLVVDDSHGLGVLGPRGSGVFAKLADLKHTEVIVVSSLGKALGIPGGLVISNAERIAWVKRMALYGGAAPVSLAYLDAMISAEKIYEDAVQKLKQNIGLFRDQSPGSFSNRLPITRVPNSHFKPLFKGGILLSQLRYPTPQDELFTRIVLSAHHTAADITRLAARVNELDSVPG